MRKWFHSIVSVLAIVAGVAVPIVQHAVAANPITSIVIGGAWAIIGHWLPSPFAKSNP